MDITTLAAGELSLFSIARAICDRCDLVNLRIENGSWRAWSVKKNADVSVTQVYWNLGKDTIEGIKAATDEQVHAALWIGGGDRDEV